MLFGCWFPFLLLSLFVCLFVCFWVCMVVSCRIVFMLVHSTDCVLRYSHTHMASHNMPPFNCSSPLSFALSLSLSLCKWQQCQKDQYSRTDGHPRSNIVQLVDFVLDRNFHFGLTKGHKACVGDQNVGIVKAKNATHANGQDGEGPYQVGSSSTKHGDGYAATVGI